MANEVAQTVTLISATRMTEGVFWQQSALGQSIQRIRQDNVSLVIDIAFENTQGLSRIYNDAINSAQENSTLVLLHDDVWIDDPRFLDTIESGLLAFDVIGVAGNRCIQPGQPAWAFIDTKFTWDKKANLSGSIRHGKQADGVLSQYGPSQLECELLDGVFLAVRKKTLASTKVRFDERFDFHFYDMDFCRSARKAGLKPGTWPINLTHQSDGNFGSKAWRKALLVYLDKWEAESSDFRPVEVPDELETIVAEVIAAAQNFREQGLIEEACECLRQVLEIQPDNPDANFYFGSLAADTRSVEDALPYLEKAALGDRDSETYWISYIEALTVSGDTDKAMSSITLASNYGLTAERASLLRDALPESSEQIVPLKPIDQVFQEVLASNVNAVKKVLATIDSEGQYPEISPDLDVVAFKNNVEALLQADRIDDVLTLVFSITSNLKNTPEFVGHKVSISYFDHVLENIDLKISDVKPAVEKHANLVIASEIYDSGGHTKVISELLAEIDSPVLVITDVFNRFNESDTFEKIIPDFPECPVFVLPGKGFLDKAQRLARFINGHAKNVFLLSHHEDSVAVTACQKNLQARFYFVHHADHNPSLGNHVSTFQHVDLFAEVARQCEKQLDSKVHILPVHADDLGAKVFSYPVKKFSTISAGAPNKFDFSGLMSLARYVALAIKTSGGLHYHFGSLTNDQINLIVGELENAAIAPQSFVYMGNVPSLWKAMCEVDAHVYIGSFPVRGGKGEIEAQGASLPMLIYKNPDGPKYLTITSCNPLTHYWHTPINFCDGLRRIMLDHENSATQSRQHYLAHHSKSHFLKALHSLVQ
ncbi:MAG: glycosyltransferase [Granulosicoccus sp.]